MSCLAHANFDEVGNVCSLSESNKILDDLKVSALERSNDQQRKVASVVRFVTRKLKLKVNETKIAVHRADETEFLGFAFRSRKANVNVTAKNLAKLKQRVRELTARNRGVSFSRMVAELSRYLRGWMGYFALDCRKQIWSSLDGWIRRRVRIIRNGKRRSKK